MRLLRLDLQTAPSADDFKIELVPQLKRAGDAAFRRHAPPPPLVEGFFTKQPGKFACAFTSGRRSRIYFYLNTGNALIKSYRWRAILRDETMETYSLTPKEAFEKAPNDFECLISLLSIAAEISQQLHLCELTVQLLYCRAELAYEIGAAASRNTK